MQFCSVVEHVLFMTKILGNPLLVCKWRKIKCFHFFNVENQALIAGENNEFKMWHLRYGHLNIKGMPLLSQKGMIFKLPQIVVLVYVKGTFMKNKKENLFQLGSRGEFRNALS